MADPRRNIKNIADHGHDHDPNFGHDYTPDELRDFVCVPVTIKSVDYKTQRAITWAYMPVRSPDGTYSFTYREFTDVRMFYTCSPEMTDAEVSTPDIPDPLSLKRPVVYVPGGKSYVRDIDFTVYRSSQEAFMLTDGTNNLIVGPRDFIASKRYRPRCGRFIVASFGGTYHSLVWDFDKDTWATDWHYLNGTPIDFATCANLEFESTTKFIFNVNQDESAFGAVRPSPYRSRPDSHVIPYIPSYNWGILTSDHSYENFRNSFPWDFLPQGIQFYIDPYPEDGEDDDIIADGTSWGALYNALNERVSLGGSYGGMWLYDGFQYSPASTCSYSINVELLPGCFSSTSVSSNFNLTSASGSRSETFNIPGLELGILSVCCSPSIIPIKGGYGTCTGLWTKKYEQNIFINEQAISPIIVRFEGTGSSSFSDSYDGRPGRYCVYSYSAQATVSISMVDLPSLDFSFTVSGTFDSNDPDSWFSTGPKIVLTQGDGNGNTVVASSVIGLVSTFKLDKFPSILSCYGNIQMVNHINGITGPSEVSRLIAFACGIRDHGEEGPFLPMNQVFTDRILELMRNNNYPLPSLTWALGCYNT